MEEETEFKEDKIEKGTNKEKLFRYLVGIISVITIIILIFVKIQNKDFPFIWIILAIIFFAFLLFIPFIYQKIITLIDKGKKQDKSDELPEPASQEELWKIVKDVLTNERYQNHIKEQSDTIPYTIGKNLIYDFVVRPLYGNQIVHVIINAHFPKRIPAILFEPNKYELNKVINSQSTNPESNPDEEVTITKNPILGTETETRKRTHHKKEKKKEEEKEDKELI